MSRGFNVSLYQIAQGYCYFRGEPLPGKLPFTAAGDALIRDFGRERVKAVLGAIDNSNPDDAAAQTAAKTADPGA